MSTGARVGAFAALLVVVFLVAAVVGRAVDPDGGTGAEHGATGTTAHGGGHGAPTGAAAEPGGLAIAADGYRLVAAATTRRAGDAAPLRFAIVDAGGATVRDFDVEQGKRMHLIVVRRDLRGFQHLHPRQAADGSWSVPLTLQSAGAYRAFADFQTAGERRTLGFDLLAGGRFEPRALPPPSTRAATGGYDVELHEHGTQLRFDVTRAGRPVTLEPYLGAYGHLVVVRAGDLAYEHVHPVAGTRGLAFEVGRPEPGAYRAFVQFRHGGAVHTAAFTREVAP